MAVSIFDVLGPITVGPSSSHTAGAVRLGRICRRILGQNIKKAKITFYGSFAETYRGHGTDKAVIGGLLDLGTDNEMIRESLKLARLRGLSFDIATAEDSRLHPNTVMIEAEGADRRVTVVGASVGGGAILLTRINSHELSAACALDTLAVFSRDLPGVLAAMTKLLADAGYNVSNLRLSRVRRAGDVVSTFETDLPVDPETVAAMRQIETVSEIIQIPKV